MTSRPGQGPEDVDVGRGQEPEREEHRAGQAAEHRHEQAERQDQALGDDEQPDVEPERGDQLAGRLDQKIGRR